MRCMLSRICRLCWRYKTEKKRCSAIISISPNHAMLTLTRLNAIPIKPSSIAHWTTVTTAVQAGTHDTTGSWDNATRKTYSNNLHLWHRLHYRMPSMGVGTLVQKQWIESCREIRGRNQLLVPVCLALALVMLTLLVNGLNSPAPFRTIIRRCL